MQITIVVNPKAQGYTDFIEDLQNELRALNGLQYTQVEAPAPPKTLNLEHDIVKLVFDHGADAMKLIVALLQVTQAVADRWKKPRETKGEQKDTEPVAILTVDDRNLAFPASDKDQRNLLKAVRLGRTKKQRKKSTFKRKKTRKTGKKSTRKQL